MRIAIVYELASREIDNALLIKAELERRGHTVRILSKATCFIWNYVPDVVLIPNCYETKDVELYSFMTNARRSSLIDMQYEQVLSRIREEQGANDPTGLSQSIPIHLCWGQRTQRRMLKANVPLEHSVITGACHMDFLKPEFSSYYADRSEISQLYGIDAASRWHLYIADFVYNNNREIAPDDMVNQTRRKFVTRCQHETVKMFERLLEDEPNDTIIYRPHPAEIVDAEILELNMKSKRFFIIGDMSIKQWIVLSDTITTWMSSAIVECYYAKKRCIVYRPSPIPEEYDSFLFAGMTFADNYEDYYRRLKQETVDDCYPETLINMINDYYGNGGAYAYRLIADVAVKPHERVSLEKFTRRRLLFMFTKPYFFKNILEKVYIYIYQMTRLRLSKIIPIKTRYLRIIEQRCDDAKSYSKKLVECNMKKARQIVEHIETEMR